MNRRHFNKISILGIAASFLPSTFLFAKGIQKVTIGPLRKHVRHGGFTDDFYPLPINSIQIQRDLFYANGIEPSVDGQDQLMITLMDGSNRKTIPFKQGESKFAHTTIRQYEIMQDQQVQVLHAGVIVPVEGQIIVDGVALEDDHAIAHNKKVNISGVGKFISLS